MLVRFIDGIRQGEEEEVTTLEDPWLQIKNDQGQQYHLQDNPKSELEVYRYSIFSKPAIGFNVE
jgi:hypothetical protein